MAKETKENPNTTKEDWAERANKFISDPMYLVWRDPNGTLVSTAAFKMNEKRPRLGLVYTLPEARGHSYAKMLVHYLTSQVLNTGKTPMMFTDFDYPASNRCYQAVGYKLNCTIVNFIPPSPKKTKTQKTERMLPVIDNQKLFR